MTIVKLITVKHDRNHLAHMPIFHFGYRCELGPNGELLADVPDDLLQGELAAGRAVLVDKAQ